MLNFLTFQQVPYVNIIERSGVVSEILIDEKLVNKSHVTNHGP